MVSGLNIKLSGEQIRSIIRAIDLDGGGYIDFPEFEAAVKRHEDVSMQEKEKRNASVGRFIYDDTPHIDQVFASTNVS